MTSSPISVDSDQDAAAPDVSVCIPTYNQSAFVSQAIESVLAQDFFGRIEIIVADDCSTDDTALVLNALSAENATVRWFQQAENRGIAGNSSSVLRAARADFVIRLDSDDVLEPRFVRRMVELMREYKGSGYGHSAVNEINSAGELLRERRIARPTGFMEAERALRASLSGYRTAANILMFRREALEAAGFLDGRPDFVEDYDLAVHLADLGWGNVYADELLARYRVWEDKAGTRSRRKALQLRGFIAIFERRIQPAWERRGWSRRAVLRRRRALAAENAPTAYSPDFTPAETREIVELVRQLGPGFRLELALFISQRGFGSRLQDASHALYRLKGLVKRAIRLARRLRS